MGVEDIPDPAVRAVFDAYPLAVRSALLGLRRLILDTAAETPGVGPIQETLRWKQPAYLTSQSGSGTTLRIDALKGSSERYGLYVNCKTTLLDSFRSLYAAELTFEGERALLFHVDRPPTPDVLRHCIALALTYHRDKVTTRRA